jgi:hypothetical protein
MCLLVYQYFPFLTANLCEVKMSPEGYPVAGVAVIFQLIRKIETSRPAWAL